MSTTYVVVTTVAAALAAFSAFAIYSKAEFVVGPLADYGVPRSWWPWLAGTKLAGAAGLIAGLFVPWVGVAAAIGLVLYFTGALVTVLRARSWAHIPAPLLYLAPAAASLVLS
ncbi:DoxX family protein [Amycolatopsis sp. 195334CR]|uniref:DoxX family protein n=1 Tax=Amycolatopsis sp. 195334CR TaxID=2814588 RepID=UPI001A8EED5E|nr:DoxX family protein [Amycolatopsis sp. 195334CR]MBN6037694.1 DoxX family protein [Amycolatopsis sp. 195334CR]